MRIRQRIKVGHDVYIPEGVEDVVYDELFTDDFTDDVDQTDTGSENDGPPVPETFNIISQTLREAKDGSQVVDVEVEVDDFEGYEIEFRITKEGSL